MFLTALTQDHRGTGTSESLPLAGPLLWAPLIVAGLAAAFLFINTGFTFDFRASSGAGAYVIAVLAAQELQRRRVADWLSGFILYNSYLTLLGTVGIMAAYGAATYNRPLVDGTLLTIDQAIGYDWQTYAGFFATHEMAARLILPAYTLAYVIPTLTITLLVVTRRAAHVERYLLAMLIATALTVALFALFPARTAWGHLGIPLDQVKALHYLPLPDRGWEHDLMMIRGGSLRTIAMAAGIVAFPSLHCATALLAGWAVWSVRRLRWPLLAINGATVLSTPIVGGHYMADMIGGLGVAVLAVIGANALHRYLTGLGHRRRASVVGISEPALA